MSDDKPAWKLFPSKLRENANHGNWQIMNLFINKKTSCWSLPWAIKPINYHPWPSLKWIYSNAAFNVYRPLFRHQQSQEIISSFQAKIFMKLYVFKYQRHPHSNLKIFSLPANFKTIISIKFLSMKPVGISWKSLSDKTLDRMIRPVFSAIGKAQKLSPIIQLLHSLNANPSTQ